MVPLGVLDFGACLVSRVSKMIVICGRGGRQNSKHSLTSS